MTRLSWGVVGQRFYEAGVDRGVLYVAGKPGVPWDGLVSVTESPTGGEARAYYIDGVKYLNKAANEEYEATIEAYTYPSEFAECDGTASIKNGLFVTQQKRKSFGLAYRSRVGNDLDGIEHGYKIHLVYDALAAPSSQTHASIGESFDPDNFSWSVTTKASRFGRQRPASHFVIDSREAPGPLLRDIEDILYGNADAAPRLPSIAELIYLFEFYSSSFFDAGLVGEPYFQTFDSGHITVTQTEFIDAGHIGIETEGTGTIPIDFTDGGVADTAASNIYDGGSVTATTTTIQDGGAP